MARRCHTIRGVVWFSTTSESHQHVPVRVREKQCHWGSEIQYISEPEPEPDANPDPNPHPDPRSLWPATQQLHTASLPVLIVNLIQTRTHGTNYTCTTEYPGHEQWPSIFTSLVEETPTKLEESSPRKIADWLPSIHSALSAPALAAFTALTGQSTRSFHTLQSGFCSVQQQ